MNEDIIKHCRVTLVTNVNEDVKSFIISSLQEKYPECVHWFNDKVLPELHTDNRNLFLLYCDADLIGFSITKKKTKSRIKICSLFISESYRNMGCGTLLLKYVISHHKNSNFYLSFRCQENEIIYIHNFITRCNFHYTKKHLAEVNSNKMLDIFYEC